MFFESQSSFGQKTVCRSLTTCGSQHVRSLLLADLPTPEMTDEAHRGSLYNVAERIGHKLPAHPKCSLLADRMKTFISWPTHLHQKPHDLAVAGFFYPGTADIVTCYSCGGSLKEWEPSDNPMVEHAHWFPSCDFLLRTKGEKFIMQAQLQNQESSKEDYNAADAVFASGVESRTQSTPVQHSKYTETMDQILNTPAALSVLSMGYSKDMVSKAVERCLQSGKTKLSAIEIMKVIIDMEEEEEIGENLETENVLSETKCENVSEKECEIEHDKREQEIDFVNHHISDSKMYSQCTEEPLSEQNTMYTSSGPTTVYASSEPISSYSSTGLHLPVLDNFKALSLQKELTPQTMSSPELRQVDDLAEENRKLKESSLCKVCLDKNADTVFLPCGHLATCAECASSLRKCPLCRKFIHGTVKVYLA